MNNIQQADGYSEVIHLFNEQQCIKFVISVNGNITYLTPKQRTPAVCMATVQAYGLNVKYLTSQERTFEVCLAAFIQNVKVFSLLEKNERTL